MKTRDPAETAFEFDLVCDACASRLGTFVEADPFAEEPGVCPHCASRALHHESPWENAPNDDSFEILRGTGASRGAGSHPPKRPGP